MKSLPTHIIHVTSYYPPHVGGMENCVQAISEKQAEKGYTVSVFTSTIGLGKALKDRKNHKTHYLKSIEFAHTPILFTLFFRLLFIRQKSLIHVHISQAFTPEIVYMISKLRNIPYVAHIHLDVDPSGVFGFLLEPYKNIFLRRVLDNAAAVICLSEVQKDAIAKRYALPKENIQVIPNGVSDTFFQPTRTSIHTIPEILFVGRFTSQKNILLLIKAIARMKRKTHVTLIGDGELREEVETLIKELQLTNITLTGKKSPDEIRAYYKRADIFVLPSKNEGVSLAMLEAMASGLPIVASDIPMVQEFVKDVGILVEPTEEAFAKALDGLIARPQKIKQLSKLSIQKAKRYTWGSTVETIDQVYRRICI